MADSDKPAEKPAHTPAPAPAHAAPEKPNPLEDIRKGLGLFFRAAKTTIDQFPADKLEDAILQGAKEVGRAVENVARSVETQVRGAGGKKDEAATGVRVDTSAPGEAKPDDKDEKKPTDADGKSDEPDGDKTKS